MKKFIDDLSLLLLNHPTFTHILGWVCALYFANMLISDILIMSKIEDVSSLKFIAAMGSAICAVFIVIIWINAQTFIFIKKKKKIKE